MMKANRTAGARRPRTTALLWIAALFAEAALATPIPPAHFTFGVVNGHTLLVGCTSAAGSNTGGTCGSEGSGPGYAATSGGIGSASYLPLTPGGTVLGTGTAVDAMSTWTSGGRAGSYALMTYSFEATGPANVDFIPIDVLSRGVLDVSGDATAYLSLLISDVGTDANIPAGVSDPNPPRPLLALSAVCDSSCSNDWGTPGQQITSPLCVVNGDTYTITIDAFTSAGPGPGADNSASAVLDPEIKVDPPYPTSCPVSASLSQLGIDTGPGASTGYSVPEPSGLGLAAAAMLALGLIGAGRRRTRHGAASRASARRSDRFRAAGRHS
jgi:MYXO-CTERM domain-containing protein